MALLGIIITMDTPPPEKLVMIVTRKPYDLTLTGRVESTLLESLFVYRLYVLGDLNRPELEEAQKLLLNYIWRGKKQELVCPCWL